VLVEKLKTFNFIKRATAVLSSTYQLKLTTAVREEPENKMSRINVDATTTLKLTIVRADKEPKAFYIIERKLTQVVLRLRRVLLRPARAVIRLCIGYDQACSPSALVKAAVSHVRRLKRNQRKGKLILSLWAFVDPGKSEINRLRLEQTI
jgi:hypothetical protein